MPDIHSLESVRVLTDTSSAESLYGAAVLVDKPQGWSSFAVVRSLRALSDIRKVGHAGSLDPMATGLLICCLGRPATREIEQFMEMRKVYRGVLRLGQETRSYDAETEIVRERPADHVSPADIRTATDSFLGTIQQRAPMYSAVKVKGERLYKKARRGETVDRPPRVVSVYSFEVFDRTDNDVAFRVVCSKGTYIRSLVHDLGQNLDVGAHLVKLRRIAIGPYRVEDAWDIDELEEAIRSGTLTTSQS